PLRPCTNTSAGFPTPSSTGEGFRATHLPAMSVRPATGQLIAEARANERDRLAPNGGNHDAPQFPHGCTRQSAANTVLAHGVGGVGGNVRPRDNAPRCNIHGLGVHSP